MKRIAIAGEIYSANVGDQAIHACLAYLLKKADASIEIIPIDISGRPGPASQPAQITTNQRLALLQSNPALQPIFPMLNFVYDLIHRRARLAAWKSSLSRANLLVMGGGQLLMDNALGFPLKLAHLAKVAKSLDVPYTISACGVGKTWSKTARSLFRPLLVGARQITVREPLSQQRLKDFLPDLTSQVTFDPAIWAAAAYPQAGLKSSSDTIGLGVINCREVNVHLDRSQRFSEAEWLQLWLELIGELLKANRPIQLFTTGSPVDQGFAEKLLAAAQERHWQQVDLAQRPANPEALISALTNYKLVMAARLHAAVLANAFGIATIGLAWDNKIRAYYGLTQRAGLCFELAGLHPSEVALACSAIYGQPFPATEIEKFRAGSFEDARIILEQL